MYQSIPNVLGTCTYCQKRTQHMVRTGRVANSCQGSVKRTERPEHKTKEGVTGRMEEHRNPLQSLEIVTLKTLTRTVANQTRERGRVGLCINIVEGVKTQRPAPAPRYQTHVVNVGRSKSVLPLHAASHGKQWCEVALAPVTDRPELLPWTFVDRRLTRPLGSHKSDGSASN